jgi:hypothetical protein
MKRSASDDETAAADAEDKAEGKRSKVDGDTPTEHDAITASNSNTQESSGSLEVADALPSERAAPVLLGSSGTVAVAGGEEQSSSCELGGDGGSGPEAQPSFTEGAGVGASTNGTKENNHGPQSCSARAGSTGESSNTATGHTFDTMEDVDILEYTRDHSGSLTFPEKVRGGDGKLVFSDLFSLSYEHTSLRSLSVASRLLGSFTFPLLASSPTPPLVNVDASPHCKVLSRDA